MLRRLSRAMSGKPEKKPEKKPEAPAPVAAPAEAEAPAPARVWRSAKDPKTSRTYYYDVLTRETRWTKPRELQGDAERKKQDDDKVEKRKFFDEMERNIRNNIAQGLDSSDVSTAHTSGPGWRPPASRPSVSSTIDEGRVRTLSTVDDSFLYDDAQKSRRSLSRNGVTRRSLSPEANALGGSWPKKPPRPLRSVSFADEKADLRAFARAAALDKADALKPPSVERHRNSTGTMFVGATLDRPDKEATIACVCHVLRAHLAAAEAQPPSARETKASAGEFKIFREDAFKRTPTAAQLEAFYRDVFSRGQMEVECIVTSLIYVERLLKAARGRVRLRAQNWRPVLLSCMIMASKVCDDLSMWNADFGHICAEFTLPRINQLEAALLRAYGFNATVAASEYAKYYFHLRSMASRLSLETDVLPLNIKAATKLSERSSQLSKKGDAKLGEDLARLKVRRAQSLGGSEHDLAARSATLEEVVDMAPVAGA